MNLSATHAISVSPTTGETLSSVPWASEQQVDAAIALAEQGYRQWRNVSVAERAATLRNVGSAMRARGEALAQMISREMGKPIAQARGEVAKSANLCDWYAEHGPAMLNTEATQVEDNKAVIEYRPMGLSSLSCRGTSRCGRCCAARCPFCWRATAICLSMRQTCWAARR